MLLGMKHKQCLPLIRHPPQAVLTFNVTGDETQGVLTSNKTPNMLLGMKHRQFLPLIKHPQAFLTFNKTPTMLLGMKHKQFLTLIRHPPCYWG